MDELHLTKKDFKIDWFSGQGAGGQKRNKTQACCRITHIESGLTSVGQDHANRVSNQRDAFNRLARLILTEHDTDEVERRDTSEVIRNYHAVRNEVHDKASGLKQSYKKVVLDGDLSDMIEARKMNMGALDED